MYGESVNSPLVLHFLLLPHVYKLTCLGEPVHDEDRRRHAIHLSLVRIEVKAKAIPMRLRVSVKHETNSSSKREKKGNLDANREPYTEEFHVVAGKVYKRPVVKSIRHERDD